MKAYFMRHGQTNYNVKDICSYKITKKVHLTKLGKEQVEKIAEKLKKEDLVVIFVSQLWRTRESAEIINKYHNVKIIEDKRINDRKTGFDERPHSEYLKAIEKDKFNIKLKGGESFQEEKARVFSFLYDLKKMKYERVLVVTHEEPIKIINGYFNNLSDGKMLELKVPNAYLIEFEI